MAPGLGLTWRTVWQPETSPELWEWRHYARAYDEYAAEMKRRQAEEARRSG